MTNLPGYKKPVTLKNDPLLKLIVALIRKIIALIRRHPFLSTSIAVHLFALYFIFSYGSYEYKQQQLSQEKVNIDESLHRLEKFQRQEIKKRVENIEKMKQLLDQSIGDTPEEIAEKTTDSTSESGTKNKAPDLSEADSPSDLLERAKSLSKAIQKVSKEIQAEDMARVLNMPKEEAMKKVEEKIAAEEKNQKEHEQKEQAQKEKTNSDKQGNENSQDVAKVNDEIKRLENEAKKVLEKRKQQLDSANNGFKIHPVSAETNPDQQSENNLSNIKSKQQTSGGGSGAGRATDNSPETQSKRIEAFLSKDAPSRGWGFSESDISRIPSAPDAQVKATGRSFGAGGQYAERVYLNRWYVIGPFLGNSDLKLFNNPSYPPEDLVDLNAVYIGKEDRILKWQYVSQSEYPFAPPDPTTDAIYYGYNEIKFDQATDLSLWLGADDDLQVWVNDRLVWRGGNVNKQALYDIAYNSGDRYWKAWNLSDGKINVHFEKGINRVLFKLSNGPNPKGVFASIVLTKG